VINKCFHVGADVGALPEEENQLNIHRANCSKNRAFFNGPGIQMAVKNLFDEAISEYDGFAGSIIDAKKNL